MAKLDGPRRPPEWLAILAGVRRGDLGLRARHADAGVEVPAWTGLVQTQEKSPVPLVLLRQPSFLHHLRRAALARYRDVHADVEPAICLPDRVVFRVGACVLDAAARATEAD